MSDTLIMDMHPLGIGYFNTRPAFVLTSSYGVWQIRKRWPERAAIDHGLAWLRDTGVGDRLIFLEASGICAGEKIYK